MRGTFPCLLRLCHRPIDRECESDGDNAHFGFSILDFGLSKQEPAVRFHEKPVMPIPPSKSQI
jgi:hypothetical protein